MARHGSGRSGRRLLHKGWEVVDCVTFKRKYARERRAFVKATVKRWRKDGYKVRVRTFRFRGKGEQKHYCTLVKR